MSVVFVDTVCLQAILLPRDQWHDQARAWSQSLVGPFVTSDYVLLELADALSAPPDRHAFAEIRQVLITDPQVRIVPQSSALFARGIELFENRPDKTWSLTDCLSFVVMQDQGITDALTHDHHFEQAGFRALLRQQPPP